MGDFPFEDRTLWPQSWIFQTDGEILPIRSKNCFLLMSARMTDKITVHQIFISFSGLSQNNQTFISYRFNTKRQQQYDLCNYFIIAFKHNKARSAHCMFGSTQNCVVRLYIFWICRLTQTDELKTHLSVFWYKKYPKEYFRVIRIWEAKYAWFSVLCCLASYLSLLVSRRFMARFSLYSATR